MKRYLFLVLLSALFCKGVWAANTQHREENAALLGWIAADNMCHGYFKDTPIASADQPLSPLKSTPVTISADSSELQYTGISTLSGQVELTQPSRKVTANRAHLTADQGDYQTADFEDQVTIREPGRMMIGSQADLDLKKQWYRIRDVIYRLFVGNNLSGWGKASQVTQPPSGITELKNITYSTCPPQSRAWHLTAKQLKLDKATGRGHATQAVLYVQGMPVLYSPYLNFPIDNRRQSGFLYPQFSFGSQSGFGIGAPYYWNIAPNLDDTITPFVYAKRGFQLNNQFRYLTQTSRGNMNINFLPNDAAFRRFQQTEPLLVPHAAGLNTLIDANPMRSYISLNHQTQFNPDWAASINYNRVSDDYYAQDLGNIPLIAQNQLLQQGQLTYTGDNVAFLANLQGFQTLHPVNQAFVSNQYNMLPQLLLTAHSPLKYNKFNYSITSELVNFSETKNPGDIQTPPSGQRLNVLPAISLPLSNTAGFITPKLGFELTQYSVGDQPAGFPNEITRALPIFNIDSGLYFQRDTHFFAHDYIQTLEPRIFYLYVPFRDQSDIPIFDSSLQPFSFNQLFTTNRFTGSDRIGDANQISFALSSRFLDSETGDEKFSAGAGMIKYLQDRRVCLTAVCKDSPYAVGSTSVESPVSPIVGQAQYHFNPQWSSTINAAWDPNIAQTQNAAITFQYAPLPNQVFNIGYNYVRQGDFFTLPSDAALPKPNDPRFDLSQPTVSFATPLNDRWSILGSLSYSLNRQHALTYFSGVTYNSCCWAIQVILAKEFSQFNKIGIPQYNTGIYVQLAFKGLSKTAANDPGILLTNNIPGYQDSFNAL